ncbi:hypothetical protein LTS08_004405 [Lithohypha guttulata]|nr:hypothetical protein LTS08_004405 [Lithohypha guttulata]
MSYQLLELSQSAAVAQTDIDYFEDHPLPSILGAKPWSSMRVNEGSNLAAYTKYEYFLKKPPSLMSNVQTFLNVVPANANPELMHKAFGVSAPCITSIHDVLSQLEEFSYVAIFPFYNHVDQILKCIRRMTALKKLFVKLCPEPESTVLDDEIKAAEGHFDINDPWNEMSVAYTLVAHTVRYLGIEGKLECLIVDDFKVEAVREAIVSTVSGVLVDPWLYDEHGGWNKGVITVTANGDTSGTL